MNGLPPELQNIQIGNPEVVSLLEAALNDARAGRIRSVALIMVIGPGSLQCATAGNGVMEFVAGSEILKNGVLAAMSGQGRSPIVRA